MILKSSSGRLVLTRFNKDQFIDLESYYGISKDFFQKNNPEILLILVLKRWLMKMKSINYNEDAKTIFITLVVINQILRSC